MVISFGEVVEHEVAGRSAAHTLLEIVKAVIVSFFGLFYLLAAFRVKLRDCLNIVVRGSIKLLGFSEARALGQFSSGVESG